MTQIYKDAGVLVGLEIHQQLSTGRKLFCGCSGTAPPGRHEEHFVRYLRPVRSEMGNYDDAALFEGSRARTIRYSGEAQNSCMVEYDEEPPHDIDANSVRTALTIAAAMESDIFDEIYVMRKTVIDGSNTSGFQRTMLVAQGGAIRVGDYKVGVQSICLEEDSARPITESHDAKEYALDRLGIPLIEIALEPVSGTPGYVREVAWYVGRLLRGTGMVARGIGSIRQDVNVSVRDGGGVVEIKGIQQLEQLEKAIEYEAHRQAGLVDISKRIKRQVKKYEAKVLDVTGILESCESKIIHKSIKSGNGITAMSIRNFAGLLGYEPYPGIRLGREIGQMVKQYGIGGIFHSDELPAYGITEKDMVAIRDFTGAGDNDGIIMIAAPAVKTGHIIQAIANRLEQAHQGVPAETRRVNPDGTTTFLRPRPGSARMYPETDVPPVLINDKDIQEALKNVPKPWEERVSETSRRYGISAHLAGQLLDSEYTAIFSDIVRDTSVSSAFVASALCSTIVSLERQGLEAGLMGHGSIREIFALLDSNDITKESVEIIFREIMSGRSRSVKEAVERTGSSVTSDDEVSRILDDIISSKMDLIRNLGDGAAGPLMGAAMTKLRGKAPGHTVNRMLVQKITDVKDTLDD